jgi:hypothetical protein
MSEFSKELVNYAIIRLDGAWFRFVMQKYGIEDAVELDAEVWRDWTMRVSWQIKKMVGIPRDHQFTSIEEIFEALDKVSKISGELMGFHGEVSLEESTIISKISNCQYWESIKKAGFDQFAEAGLLCSKVHTAGYEGLLEGVFPDISFNISHTKSIPSGSSCCEVVIEPQL